MEKILNDIELLTPSFKEKVKLFLDEARSIWLNIKVFESLRTMARQKELYSIWRRWIVWEKVVTWTMNSNHIIWKAIDVVFIDFKWRFSWSWNYDTLIEIWKKYWINNLKPKETCHFEDNWIPLNLKPKTMSKYTELLNSYIAKWYKPIFEKREWENTLNTKEVKELIEIAFAKKGL